MADHGALREIAWQFVAARRRYAPLDLAVLVDRAWTLDDAYTVQETTASLMGVSVGGYKIGLTSTNARRAMDAVVPIAGYVERSRILPSPARISVGPHMRVVEAELVVALGQDLVPSGEPFTQTEVAGAISGLFAGIEICDTRFNADEVSLPCLVADNGFADRLVIGDRLDVPVGALDRIAVRLDRSQGECVQGATDRVDGGPLAAVTWLANHLAGRGQLLQAGQIIATGSCTGITTLNADEGVVACFTYLNAELGTASVKFEQHSQEESF